MHATDKTGMQQHASQCQSQGGCLTDDACTSQREPDCLDLGHRLGVSKLAMYSMACAGPTCYAAPYNPPPSTSGVPALHSQHTWAVMSSGILGLALVSSFVCFHVQRCTMQIAADNAVFGQTGPKVGSFDAGYGSSQMVRLIGELLTSQVNHIHCKRRTNLPTPCLVAVLTNRRAESLLTSSPVCYG